MLLTRLSISLGANGIRCPAGWSSLHCDSEPSTVKCVVHRVDLVLSERLRGLFGWRTSRHWIVLLRRTVVNMSQRVVPQPIVESRCHSFPLFVHTTLRNLSLHMRVVLAWVLLASAIWGKDVCIQRLSLIRGIWALTLGRDRLSWGVRRRMRGGLGRSLKLRVVIEAYSCIVHANRSTYH
jgi:hypothetical protein